MTLFHFGNCVALAYAPYFLTYKYSGLSEYGAFWKCVTAGAMYVFTQLCKMLLMATFFPTTEFSSTGAVDLLAEFLKSTVDLADFLGIYFVMSRVAGKGDTKVLIAGLGWATADLLCTRFVPLWVGARGLEFDWKYIQMSFDSNIQLVAHLSSALLVWLWGRSDLHQSLRPVVATLLVLICYRPMLLGVLSRYAALSAAAVLMVKLFTAAGVGIAALQIYVGVVACIGSY